MRRFPGYTTLAKRDTLSWGIARRQSTRRKRLRGNKKFNWKIKRCRLSAKTAVILSTR
jgi:hypothetical protein